MSQRPCSDFANQLATTQAMPRPARARSDARAFWRVVGRPLGLLAPILLGLAPFAVGLAPRAAHASILLALGLPDLVRQADHIAVVDVVSVNAAWDPTHEHIFSTVDLKVVESWKTANAAPPAAGTHLTVVQPGGTVGDITMTVTGLGGFSPGERSIVFLRGAASHAQLVGMTQGKRPLRFHAASQRWLVAPPNLRQATLVRPTTKPTTKPTTIIAPPTSSSTTSTSSTTAAKSPAASTFSNEAGSPAKDMALDDFRAEVKRLLATPAATPTP